MIRQIILRNEVKRMRTYVKPTMEIVNLRVEERISGSTCMVGSCIDKKTGELIYNSQTN